jgi:hypothetical protein
MNNEHRAVSACSRTVSGLLSYRWGVVVSEVNPYRGHSVSTQTPADTLIDDKQLAEEWDINRNTPANWRTKGVGPRFIRLTNGTIRYRRSDLEAYVAERVRRSTSDGDDDDRLDAA